jgi:hypothetical protein
MFFRMGAVGWIIVLVLIVMILGMIDNMFFHRGVGPAGAIAPPGPAALPTPPSGAQGPTALPAPTSGGSSPSSPAALPDPAIAAAARAELSEAAKLLTEASESTHQAVKQIAAWESDIEPLLGNADGQAIAAHAESARQMAFLLQEERPLKGDVTLVGERIKSLADETTQLSATDPPGRLGSDKVNKVRELHRQSHEASLAWTDAVQRARAIAREARRQQSLSTASSPPAAAPSTPPPMSTTASTTQPQTQPQTPPPAVTPPAPSAEPTPAPPAVSPSAAAAPPTAAPATTTVLEPAAPKVTTLQDTVERIRDQTTIDALNKKIAAETERRRKEDERRAEELRIAGERAIQKAKLVAEARSDEVLRVLQPFLERRSVQPRLAGSSLQWRQTVEQKPMSLSALDNVGALADSVQGLAMLARVGSHRDLSSPRWEFSPSPRTWSSDTQDRLKQAQELLRRLGPTLVEEGLLSR